jgi:hypothetical protein
MTNEHTARVLAMVRQMEEMELTRSELAAVYGRHILRETTASRVIAEAAHTILTRR